MVREFLKGRMGNSGNNQGKTDLPQMQQTMQYCSVEFSVVHPMSFMVFPLQLPAPSATDVHGKSHKNDHNGSAWLHIKHFFPPLNPTLFTYEVSMVMMDCAGFIGAV